MKNNGFFQKIGLLMVIFALLISAVGCSSGNKADMDRMEAGSAAAPEMMYESMSNSAADVSDSKLNMMDKAEGTSTTAVALPENRKLIQTVNMTVETDNLDGLMNQLNQQIAAASGYVESQNIYNGSAYSGRRYRNAELTIRVPADQLEGFVNQVSGAANVVTSNRRVQDITLSYVATESRMKALETEQTRLLELLSMAENMDDLLTVEKRLTEVRTEIEQVGSVLRLYDNQVDYATVSLSISEVTEYTVIQEPPATMGQRIRVGFRETLEDMGDGLEDFCVFVVVNIPYFVILAVGIGILILIFRIRKKKKAAKKPEKPEIKE